MARTVAVPSATSSAMAAPALRTRWLLFVHQLPASPSNLRVRTWRRMQQIGALPVKQSVYALPDTPATREDFEWLATEVKDAGGDASVFIADTVDAWSHDALVEEFRQARQDAYGELAVDIEHATTAGGGRRKRNSPAAPSTRTIDAFRTRLTALERIDYFGSAGRDRVVTLLARLEAESGRGRRRPAVTAAAGDTSRYMARLWVTRPRPGVDRMSSAWLIRRFVDTKARFAFAPDKDTLPAADAIPFDMFGVTFTHQGDGCTFETLAASFAIDDPAVARIAAIVHDLDFKDGRFGAAEGPAVAAVIDGLQLATEDDDALLERGITLFESLYLAFAQSARTGGPRPVARAPRSRGPKAPAKGRTRRT